MSNGRPAIRQEPPACWRTPRPSVAGGWARRDGPSRLAFRGTRTEGPARVAHHLNNFVTEFAADEARYASAAAAMGLTRRALLADARKQLRALPPDEFPSVLDLADELARDDPDGFFEFGIQVWLRAIEALSRRRW
jgi:hypothetical protein